MAIKFLNNVAVDTNVLFVDTINDRVGIGTTSPVSPLHVNSTGVTTLRISTSSSSSEPQILLIDGASDYFAIQKVDRGITFKPQGSEKMRIDSDGNVGIGTTSPEEKLHVSGTTKSSTFKTGAGSIVITGQEIYANDEYTGNDGAIRLNRFGYQGGQTKFRDVEIFDGKGTSIMKVDGSSGNVGIGTNSPSFKLDVSGDGIRNIRSTAGWAGWFQNNASSSGVIITAGVDSGDAPLLIRKQDTTEIFSVRGNGTSYFQNGNVGIGTTSPSKKLHISGSDQSTARIRLSNTNSSGGDNIDLVAGINNVGQDGFSIYNATSNQTQLVIQGSGNVGIAVTDFTTTFGSVPDLRVGSISGTGNPGVIDILRKDGTVTAGETTGILQFSVDDDSNYCNAQIEVESASTVGGGNSGGGILKFKTTPSSSGGTPTERMRIDSSGDVGIGTTSPAGKLEINGGTGVATSGGTLIVRQDGDTSNDGIALTSSNAISHRMFKNAGGTFLMGPSTDSDAFALDLNGNVGIGTASPLFKLDVDGDVRVSQPSKFTFANGQYLKDDGSAGLDIASISGTGSINFITNSTDKMIITSAGSVGIGTTNPGQRLHVNGNVTADRYYGTGSTTYYVDPNNTTQSAYFAGDIRITDSGRATIKLDSTSSQDHGGSIIVTKNGSESPSMGSITWVQNPGFMGSIWSQRLTSSPYTESAIQLPTSSSYDFNIKVLGSNRMTIDSSTGNVGIGTTSPGRQLVVYNSSNAELELYSGATNSGFVYFRDSGDSNIGALQYDHNSNYMAFRVNDSERMRIDSSGKVGIGTTSPNTTLEVGDCESSGNISDGNIAVKTKSNNTAIVIQEQEVGGAEQWGLGVNVDGDLIFTDSGTERIRFDDGTGNVGIGTTAPAEKLVVSGSDDVSIRINSTKNGTWTTGQLLGAYEFYGNDASGAGAQIKGKIDCASLNQYGAGFHMRFFTAGGGGGTSAIERMRINSSGAVTIGKTDPSSYNTQGIDLSPSGLASFTRSGNVSLLVNRTGSDGQVVSIRNDNTSVGSISVSGSTTSYNTSSDYRLKENVVDMTGAIERIQQLKPKRFNFISNTEKTVDGFIAHEVQNIIPEAVLGEKDAVDEDGNPELQGIDQSKIVPLLVGAIKELKAEIENLKLQIN